MFLLVPLKADRANLLHLAALRNTPLHEFYSAGPSLRLPVSPMPPHLPDRPCSSPTDIRGVDQNETSAPFHKIKATLASSGASEKLQLKAS